MRTRSTLACLLLLGACCALAVGLQPTKPEKTPEKQAAQAKPRLLPGIQLDGEIRLPNQWSLRPAGSHLVVGKFPVNIAVHPSGSWLAILHAGYGTHEIILVDVRKTKPHIVSRVSLTQTFYGITFSPDGKKLFASGAEFEVVHAFDFVGGLLAGQRRYTVAPTTETFIPSGIATDETGETLFVAGPWGDALCVLPLADQTKRKTVQLPKGSYPYLCLPEPKGKRLFVSLWGGSGVAVLDRESLEMKGVWPTKSHPTEMALSPNGKTLFVSCANSTSVSVLDTTQNGKELETISCALYPNVPSGNTPNSLSLSDDGKLLFVANADANNIAVVNVSDPGHSKPMGFIPVGWYPTSVRYDSKKRKLYVVSGKGMVPRANPQGPTPFRKPELSTLYQYIGNLYDGTLSVIPMPNPEQMTKYTKAAYTCSPLRRGGAVTMTPTKDNPIPSKVGGKSPIKYCIYVVKENRTYDQIFGDIQAGNGDPSLCIFGEKVTPNHHRLAKQFVLLDNFYVDGEVSADGHQWSMGAYATDFVEKVWPQVYRGSPLKKLSRYPSEGGYPTMEKPAGGYIWDRCAEAKVSYRSYGEWVTNGKTHGRSGHGSRKVARGTFRPAFLGLRLELSRCQTCGAVHLGVATLRARRGHAPV